MGQSESQPMIKITPTENTTTSSAGSDVTLKCKVENCNGSQISWTNQNGQDINECGKYKMKTAGGFSSLIIHKVENKDEGFYYCTTKEVEAKINLKIQPSITRNYRCMEADSKSEVVLSCNIIGADHCNWTFKRKVNDKMDINIKVPSEKYSINEEFSLTINSADEKDEGEYTCCVTNTHSDLSATSEPITLDILFGPVFPCNEAEKTRLRSMITDTSFADFTAGIVLYGHAGAGKSSFINSIYTAMTDSISTVSPQAKEDEGSITNQICHFEVDGLPVVLCDVPGYHSRQSNVIENYICDVIRNNVVRGTMVNHSESTHDMPAQETDESEQNRIWCVVYVVSSMDAELLDEDDVKRVKKVFSRIRELGSDLVAVMTKIDKLDEKADLSKIYRSSVLQGATKALHNKIGIDEVNIHPVQNYSAEKKSSLEMDIVLLRTVQGLLDKLKDIRKYRKGRGLQ